MIMCIMKYKRTIACMAVLSCLLICACESKKHNSYDFDEWESAYETTDDSLSENIDEDSIKAKNSAPEQSTNNATQQKRSSYNSPINELENNEAYIDGYMDALEEDYTGGYGDLYDPLLSDKEYREAYDAGYDN